MKASDQQSPHGVGIAETAGTETSQDRLTPCGISDVPTEDVLKTAGDLKEADVKLGMEFNTLSPATTAALTKGFQTDVPAEGGYNDGSPKLVGGTDLLHEDSGDSMNGFLGRFNLGQVR